MMVIGISSANDGANFDNQPVPTIYRLVNTMEECQKGLNEIFTTLEEDGYKPKLIYDKAKNISVYHNIPRPTFFYCVKNSNY